MVGSGQVSGSWVGGNRTGEKLLSKRFWKGRAKGGRGRVHKYFRLKNLVGKISLFPHASVGVETQMFLFR